MQRFTTVLGIVGAAAWIGLILIGLCVVLFLSTQHVPVGLDVGIAEYFVLPVLGLAVAFLALWLLRRGRYRTALLLASVSAVPGVLLFIANSLVIVMNAGIDVAMY